MGAVIENKIEWIGQNVYVRPSYIVSMPDFYSPYKMPSRAFIDNQINLKDNSHGGTISGKADKKCRNAINWLLCASENKKVFHSGTGRWFDFKVNFITLTLPDTDQPIKEHDFKTKLLNPWLTLLRRYHGLKNYVWKIEFQKNGKLHLHITSDTFIHYSIIRKSWNKLLGSNGYLTKFSRDNGHADPNSTDIHSVRKVKDLAAYIAKYMTKNEVYKKQVRGRIWGCNFELSRANKTKIFVPSPECGDFFKQLFKPDIEYSQIFAPAKEHERPRSIGEIFYLKYKDWQTKIKGELKQVFLDTVAGLKNLIHDGTLYPDLYRV